MDKDNSLIASTENGASKTKRCAACHQYKDIIEFWKNQARKDGLGSSCKICVNAQVSKPERLKKRQVYNQINKLRTKNYYLRRYFNITIERYNEMLESQDFKCAICKCSEDRFDRGFAVDHNHITGEIRGLLCGPCNTSLGVFQADSGIEILQRALDYAKPRK